ILRTGFKQSKGMYFTHANLITFMLAALDLETLTVETWKRATHPENRLPCVIDPACGSGGFLLRAMHIVTQAIRSRQQQLLADEKATEFFNLHMAEEKPNAWAESFLYGLDPKFVMAIIARVNMVLHGAGAAHIVKADALGPFSSYTAPKLHTAGETA